MKKKYDAMSMPLLFSFSGGEIIFVVVAVLLLFGSDKIPELMRGVGKFMRDFNNAKATVQRELRDGMREAELEERRKKEEEERLKEEKIKANGEA